MNGKHFRKLKRFVMSKVINSLAITNKDSFAKFKQIFILFKCELAS